MRPRRVHGRRALSAANEMTCIGRLRSVGWVEVYAVRGLDGRVGCPLYPGDQRCSPDRMPCPASACHVTVATSLHPTCTSHRAELRFTRHQRGFTRFTRPVCPSPVALSMGRGPLRLYPRASHPTVTSSARQGQGQAASTRPGLHHRHHVGPPNCESTRKVRHRVATADPDGCDIPSTGGSRRGESSRVNPQPWSLRAAATRSDGRSRLPRACSIRPLRYPA